MRSEQRRKDILAILQNANEPITGSQLSEKFGVTRQVIVADIALLRAGGASILATPQGYIYQQGQKTEKATMTIAAIHSNNHEEIRDELYLIVDHGGTVMNVIVEHPVYGEITANLQVKSRHDVDEFLAKLGESGAEPLLTLTEGLHLHVISADDDATLRLIEEELRKHGFLADAK